MNAPRVVAAIIALCAVGLGGCQSGSGKAPAAQPAGAAKASPAKAADKPAADAGKAPKAQPAPSSTAAAPAASGDSRLAPLVREREVLRQQRETLVQNYTQLGEGGANL